MRPTEESPGASLLRVVMVMLDAKTRESLSVTRIPLPPFPFVSTTVLETISVPPPIPPGTSPTRTPLALVPGVVMRPPSKVSVPELSVQIPKLPRPQVVMVTSRAKREEPAPKLASPWLPPPEAETVAVLMVI